MEEDTNILNREQEDMSTIEEEIKKSLADTNKATKDLKVSHRINYLYLLSSVLSNIVVFFYLNFFKIT